MSAVPVAFRKRFSLIESLKFAPADLLGHYFVLKDESDADVQYAVERAAKECNEFPSPRMLKAFITERRISESVVPVRHDREQPVKKRSFTVPGGIAMSGDPAKPHKVTVQREWSYYCDDCHDTGRISVWCGKDAPPKPWMIRRTCERKYEHGMHEFVILCKCIVTNPDVPAWVKAKAQGVTSARC